MKRLNSNDKGFTLFELMIAMTITLVILGIASTLLATSFHVRSREQARTDSIADVQRAINIMSRELAIGGFGFDSSSNGLVVGDCSDSTIRVRSNLNRYSGNSGTIESSGEDVKYLVDATEVRTTSFDMIDLGRWAQVKRRSLRTESTGWSWFTGDQQTPLWTSLPILRKLRMRWGSGLAFRLICRPSASRALPVFNPQLRFSSPQMSLSATRARIYQPIRHLSE